MSTSRALTWHKRSHHPFGSKLGANQCPCIDLIFLWFTATKNTAAFIAVGCHCCYIVTDIVVVIVADAAVVSGFVVVVILIVVLMLVVYVARCGSCGAVAVAIA